MEPSFTGHNQDISGLVYMQARYYDPAIGRFLAADPIGSAHGNGGSFNRYAYANNNPFAYVDPDGRQSARTGVTVFDWLLTPADLRASNGDMMERQFAAELSQPLSTIERIELVAVAASLGAGGGPAAIRTGEAVERAGIVGTRIADEALVVRGGSATATGTNPGANSDRNRKSS